MSEESGNQNQENNEGSERLFPFDQGDLPPSPRHQEQNRSISPGCSPRDKKAKVEGNTTNIHDRKEQNPSPKPFMVAASPPKFVSFEDIMKAANGVSNMTLAHEIAVDNEFRFQKLESPKHSLEKQVREVMERAFWDALQEHLNEDPPNYTHALVLLQEVKETLLDILLPQHQRLRAEIEEIIDLDLIKQKAEHDALDFHYYADVVISFMAKLCSPARDEQIAKLKEIKDVVPLYKAIFEVLELMKMDMANFTIQQIRPYLQQQSVEYERTKFQEFLKTSEEKGVDGLECTRAWIERNGLTLYYKMREQSQPQEGVAAASPPSTSAGPTKPLLFTPNNIMNSAYMELLDWPSNQLYPETLVMDERRFTDLQKKVEWLSLISSILLVTYNTVGGAIAGISGLKEKLKSQITTILKDVPEQDMKDAMKNVSAQIEKEVNECLSKHGFSKLDEARQSMLQGQIEAVFSAGHPVYQLMKSRVMGFIKELLSGGKPSEVKIPPGFTAVTEELTHVCGQFLRLVSHNRSVFGLYYADIISTLLKKQQEKEQEEGTPV